MLSPELQLLCPVLIWPLIYLQVYLNGSALISMSRWMGGSYLHMFCIQSMSCGRLLTTYMKSFCFSGVNVSNCMVGAEISSYFELAVACSM